MSRGDGPHSKSRTPSSIKTMLDGLSRRCGCYRGLESR
jgi:hypothetical protein